MGDAHSEFEVVLRDRLKDALDQLNSATFRVQEVLQDHRSRSIPFSGSDYALWQALITETEARQIYMRIATNLHHLIMHGEIPREGAARVVKISGSE